MLTYDQNSITLTDNILGKKLEIELLSIELRNETEIITGKGAICQDENGALILKLFSDNLRDVMSRLSDMGNRLNNSNSEGQQIHKNQFYCLSGLDSNGIKYFCERVYSYRPKENFTIFKLYNKLIKERPLTETRVVCIGKYKIPKSDRIEIHTQGNGLSYITYDDIFKTELTSEITLRIYRCSSHTDIRISHIKDLYFDDINNIISSINFVFGIDLEPIFANIYNLELRFYPFPRNNVQTSNFTAPLSLGNSYSNPFFDNHKILLSCYYNFISNHLDSQLPVIQKRIWSAGQSYPYILAVTLTSQIENICKTHYNSYYETNTKFNATIDRAIRILKDSKQLDKEGFNGINSILSQKLIPESPIRQQLNVKNILNGLLKNKKISTKEYVKDWNSLRNSVAHGESISSDEDKGGNLVIVRNTQSCINLYYELVFGLINYIGVFSYKAKDLNNNKLSFYFPYCLSYLGISNNDELQYNDISYVIIDANENILRSKNNIEETINVFDLFKNKIRSHIDYIPHFNLKYNGTSIFVLANKN